MDRSLQPSSTRTEVIVCLTHIYGPLRTSSLWMLWRQHSITEAALHYMYWWQRDTRYPAARIAEMSEIIGITTSYELRFSHFFWSGLQLWSFLHSLYPPVERNTKSQREIIHNILRRLKLFSYISQSVEQFYVLKGNNSFNHEYFWNHIQK